MATPVEPEQHGSIPEHLSHLFRDSRDTVAIAGALAHVVHELQAVLSPLLGVRGVAALYQRSLHLARAGHPWLSDPVEIAQPTINLPALTSAFARQDAAEAGAAAEALLRSFHDLLVSLIGHALAARLLAPVWARSPGSDAAKDISK